MLLDWKTGLVNFRQAKYNTKGHKDTKEGSIRPILSPVLTYNYIFATCLVPLLQILAINQHPSIRMKQVFSSWDNNSKFHSTFTRKNQVKNIA